MLLLHWYETDFFYEITNMSRNIVILFDKIWSQCVTNNNSMLMIRTSPPTLNERHEIVLYY